MNFCFAIIGALLTLFMVNQYLICSIYSVQTILKEVELVKIKKHSIKIFTFGCLLSSYEIVVTYPKAPNFPNSEKTKQVTMIQIQTI